MNGGFTYVSTADGLEELAGQLERAVLMCMDCEWPSHVQSKAGTVPKASLLQLALLTRSADYHERYERHVFLVDVQEMGHLTRLRQVLLGALRSGELLKLGHSLTNDASALFRALNLPLEHHGSMSNAVDVRSLIARLSPGLGMKHAGLSAMVATLTGRKLSKDLQCSDWAARPLDPDQLQYAACDAACLVDLFVVAARLYTADGGTNGNEGKNDDKSDGMDNDGTVDTHPRNAEKYYVLGEDGPRLIDWTGPDDIFRLFGQEKWEWERGKWRVLHEYDNHFWQRPRQIKQKRGKKERRSGGAATAATAYIQRVPPISCPEGGARFVCDEMCLGLARELRLFGIDCEFIPTPPRQERHVTHRNLVELAEAEGRVILTRDSLLVKRGLSERTYFVQSDDSKHQQREEVMRAFGCTGVSREMLMSRCVSCNGLLRILIEAERLPEWVPDGVRSSFDTFWVCAKDEGHVFWRGKQYQRSLERLQGQLEGLAID